MTLWMGPLVLSDHPAKFRVDRPYGTGNNDVCNISSNSNSISNSNSNAEVPMPRFTNGHLNLIMYTAKFDALFFDQISLIKFWKNRTCSISLNYFHEKEPIKIKIRLCQEKITKIKLQMNDHKISFQVINNSRLQIVQVEFTIWKYKVKLSAEAANGGVL